MRRFLFQCLPDIFTFLPLSTSGAVSGLVSGLVSIVFFGLVCTFSSTILVLSALRERSIYTLSHAQGAHAHMHACILVVGPRRAELLYIPCFSLHERTHDFE